MRYTNYYLTSNPFADVYADNGGSHRFDGNNSSQLTHGNDSWTRVRRDNGMYGFVRTHADGTPVDFNEDATGYMEIQS